MELSVRQHARTESISKRAPSSASARVWVQRELRRDVSPKRRSRVGGQPLGHLSALDSSGTKRYPVW